MVVVVEQVAVKVVVLVVIVVDKGGDDSGDSEHGSISDASRLVDCSGCYADCSRAGDVCSTGVK